MQNAGSHQHDLCYLNTLTRNLLRSAEYTFLIVFVFPGASAVFHTERPESANPKTGKSKGNAAATLFLSHECNSVCHPCAGAMPDQVQRLMTSPACTDTS